MPRVDRAARAVASAASPRHGGGSGSNFWAKAATAATIASCAMQTIDSPRVNQASSFLMAATKGAGARATSAFGKSPESVGPELK